MKLQLDVLENLARQTQFGIELMERFHEYAKSIGCTTYDDGPLWDSIEVHNTAQSDALAEWWKVNTSTMFKSAHK